MTLHTTKIYELLADGDWHELEVVLRAAAVVVPPGPAKRAIEDARARERLRRRMDERRSHRASQDTAGLIRDGQRRVALLAINRNRRIQLRRADGRRQIRLRPKAPDSERSRTMEVRRADVMRIG